MEKSSENTPLGVTVVHMWDILGFLCGEKFGEHPASVTVVHMWDVLCKFTYCEHVMLERGSRKHDYCN